VGAADPEGGARPRHLVPPAQRRRSSRVENIKWADVFYQSGLSINVLYTLDDAGKRAVGFKLADGMEVLPNSPRGSSSPGRSPSSPAPSGVRSSLSRASTDLGRADYSAGFRGSAVQRFQRFSGSAGASSVGGRAPSRTRLRRARRPASIPMRDRRRPARIHCPVQTGRWPSLGA